MIVRDDDLRDTTFAALPAELNPGDLLVLNETRVIAARLFGKRSGSGGRVEILLLRPAAGGRYQASSSRWSVLAKPARRLHPGERILFEGFGEATVTAEGDAGVRELEFRLDVPFERFLERAGRIPLPPYIRDDGTVDHGRYQTVFAAVPGSVAAPTASLHFTPDVLARLRDRGVETARIVLDVGLGTFRPIATERIDEHVMHAEAYAISLQAAGAIDRAKRTGRRVVAAGTTVVRALEGCAAAHGRIVAGEGTTDLFITPGFEFRTVDAMITNFHLPKSSLLVLVSAFAGRDRIARAYAEAIARRYRFFSFGDAMLLERNDARR
jgi:S-adenosylmethionine:tRNA ribosyltransferase-isomerase